jgi:Leucine rich repeat
VIVLGQALTCAGQSPRSVPDRMNAIRKAHFHFCYTPSKVSRVLKFPADYSLGELIISRDAETSEEDSLNGAAKGTIVVPPGKFVTFIPAHHFYQNPAIINTLPEGGVDRLDIFASSMDASEDGLCDKALTFIGHLKAVVELKVDRSDASDQGVAHAKDLPNLQKLSAFQNSFEGNFFKQLAGHPSLRYLKLPTCSLKDENLQYLPAIPHLQHLSLSHCSLSDSGVKWLAGCQGLISLDLAENPKITDKSISVILRLKKLEALNITGTSITNEAVQKLKDLPLVILWLPQPAYDKKKLEALRSLFPATVIKGKELSSGRSLDQDTSKLYAPLH